MKKEQINFTQELLEAQGDCEYKMSNDYMFRSVFQKNQKALLGLVSALLHRRPEEITSLEITNPIEIGHQIDEKEFRLDIKLILNEDERINLEMQLVDCGDWTERSLAYLCRMYDTIPRGGNYADITPAIHIGILDFTLFPKNPSFYSSNKLMDVKTGRVYSDKFVLNVLDMTKGKLATQEDKDWQIDYWAKLFKATTWEDIKMIAENSEYMTEAANTMRELYADENLREQCRNREDYISYWKGVNDRLAYQDAELAKKIEKIAYQERELAQKDAEIANLKKLLAQQTGSQH